MGLDMYLTKITDVGAQWKHRNVTGSINIKVGENHLPIQFDRVSEIIESVGIWRKANQIHKWFVDNVQGGKDDCEEYDVEKSHVIALLKVCKEIKEGKVVAAEALPTQPGFFFGPTDYDEYYMEDIDSTIGIMERLLVEDDRKDKDYFSFDLKYRSSW